MPDKKIKAFCMKCKVMNNMNNAELTKKTYNGTTRYMMKGKCETCGTNMSKFMGADEAKKWPK